MSKVFMTTHIFESERTFDTIHATRDGAIAHARLRLEVLKTSERSLCPCNDPECPGKSQPVLKIVEEVRLKWNVYTLSLVDVKTKVAYDHFEITEHVLES